MSFNIQINGSANHSQTGGTLQYDTLPREKLFLPTSFKRNFEYIVDDFLDVNNNMNRFFKSATPFFDEGIQSSKETIDLKKKCLIDVWNFYDDPYGIEICLVNKEDTKSEKKSKNKKTVGNGKTNICIKNNDEFVYFVPYLSAVQIYLKDGLKNDNNQADFEYFEKAQPDERLPLTDKVEILSKENNVISVTVLNDINTEKSWFCISWYPIMCHAETMNRIRGQILLYHTFNVQTEMISDQYCYQNSKQGNKLNEEQSYKQSIIRKYQNERIVRMKESIQKSTKEEPIKKLFCPIVAFIPYKLKNETWFKQYNTKNHSNRSNVHNSYNVVLTNEEMEELAISQETKIFKAPLFLVEACYNLLENRSNTVHPDFEHIKIYGTQLGKKNTTIKIRKQLN